MTEKATTTVRSIGVKLMLCLPMFGLVAAAVGLAQIVEVSQPTAVAATATYTQDEGKNPFIAEAVKGGDMS